MDMEAVAMEYTVAVASIMEEVDSMEVVVMEEPVDITEVVDSSTEVDSTEVAVMEVATTLVMVAMDPMGDTVDSEDTIK